MNEFRHGPQLVIMGSIDYNLNLVLCSWPSWKLVGKVLMFYHAFKSWVKVTKHHCTSRVGKRIFESFRTKGGSGSKWLIHYRTIRLRRGYQVQCVSCKSIKLYYYYRVLNVVYFNNPSTFAVTSKCGGLANLFITESFNSERNQKQSRSELDSCSHSLANCFFVCSVGTALVVENSWRFIVIWFYFFPFSCWFQAAESSWIELKFTSLEGVSKQG